MRRGIFIAMAVLATLAFATSASWAGNPHFVTCTETISGNTITVDGKEAGLGSETQVHIELNATAQCVNPGSNKPKAANKQSLNSAGDFPVQNGQAVFQLSVTASFQPDCSPPMSVIFTDVSACDTEHGVCCSF